MPLQHALTFTNISGYMSPEYAMDGLFSIKSDVFSFGVLLLEIVSGRKSTGFYHRDCLNLLGQVGIFHVHCFVLPGILSETLAPANLYTNDATFALVIQ